MRMGNMGYISFNLIFYKRTQRGAEGPPVKIQIRPILMKSKPYVLDYK